MVLILIFQFGGNFEAYNCPSPLCSNRPSHAYTDEAHQRIVPQAPCRGPRGRRGPVYRCLQAVSRQIGVFRGLSLFSTMPLSMSLSKCWPRVLYEKPTSESICSKYFTSPSLKDGEDAPVKDVHFMRQYAKWE